MMFPRARLPAAAFASGPITLAVIRIVVALQALWMLLSRDAPGIANLPPAVWESVSPTYRLRFLLGPFPQIETVLWCIAVAALTGVVFGVGTRVLAVVASVLLYHLAPMQSLGVPTGPWGRGLTIATLALPILACSPCEDRLTLRPVRPNAIERSPDTYGWAVFLVRLLFAQLYLFSGIAKLRSVGLTWVRAEMIEVHLLLFALVIPGVDAKLNVWIASHPTLCWLLAAGTITLELGFVLAVFVRQLRPALVLGALVFHAGLWITMGFRFLNLPHLSMFLDFDRFYWRKR